jgi:sugar transferase (PEP-CTERM/EpsH1 system associated)
VVYLAMHKPPGHLARLYPRLHRLFRQHKPAIVHTRNLAALEAMVPAWTAGVPVRVHGEHGWDIRDLDGSSNRYKVLRKLYRPFVQHYIALSKHLQEYLERGIGIKQTSLAQIYNGVDTERFSPPGGERPAIPDCPFSDPAMWLVGTVGRLQTVKDQTNLARAFVDVLRYDPSAAERIRLVMVGDGPLRSDVEKILDEAGVRHLAWLPGERQDIPEVLRGLDCFVLPSLAEGISNTILEAMATGLPVVATHVGGNNELVEEGMTGKLVPAADSKALGKAITEYYRHPQVARRHGRAGRSRVERQFSLERMVRQYENVYLDLLRKSGLHH